MAVGAAVAAPQRQVINLQADGSAMYTLQVGSNTRHRRHWVRLLTLLQKSVCAQLFEGSNV